MTNVNKNIVDDAVRSFKVEIADLGRGRKYMISGLNLDLQRDDY